jgi:ankyrin repeat protein
MFSAVGRALRTLIFWATGNIRYVDALLLTATACGDEEAVKRLMLRGAQSNAADMNGRTALMFAAKGDHATVAQVLLDQGADPELEDLDGWNTLVWARVRGSSKVLGVFRERQRRVLEQRRRALYRADAGKATTGRVKFSCSDWTPLMEAANRGQTDQVQSLLAQGAEVNAEAWTVPHNPDRDPESITALEVAVLNGQATIVDLLLEAGACGVDAALQQAVEDGYAYITHRLIEHNAVADHELLAFAESEGHPAVAKVLREAGAESFRDHLLRGVPRPS